MKKKFVQSMLTIVFGVFVVYGCSNSASDNDVGRLLYDSGCNKCHDNSIVCLNLGKDSAYWKNTVNRMLKKVKNKKVDETLLLNTLLSLKKGDKSICK